MVDTRTDRRPAAELLQRLPELRIEQDDYNINVTANHGEHIDAVAVDDALRAHPGAGRPMHLYMHVPLCSYICHFCNYVKRLHRGDPSELDRWARALVHESTVTAARAPWLRAARVESVYLGGGTAAVLGVERLAGILDHIRDTYLLTSDCELSIEGNPDNFVDPGQVDALVRAGFNRFSVGVQSLQAAVTEFTNRGHTPEMSLAAMRLLRDTGLPFNVDLMFGLPRQTVQTVLADIDAAIDHDVPTITIYRFRNADRAAMGIGNRAAWNLPAVRNRLHDQGAFPSVEQTYDMREAVVGRLLAAGYRPSPCGWWNRPGTYPGDNIPRVSRNKWQRHDTMVAYGPGAYGWLCDGPEIVQTYHDTDIKAYLASAEQGDGPWLTHGRRMAGEQAVATTLGFNFKACQPILRERYRRRFGIDLAVDAPYREVFEELCARGLLATVAGGWKPTLNGETLHEEIISVYLHGRIGRFREQICKRVPA